MPCLTESEDRVDILGVRVRRLNLNQALDKAEQYLQGTIPRYGAFINVYNVIEARRSDEYRRALNEADMPKAGAYSRRSRAQRE